MASFDMSSMLSSLPSSGPASVEWKQLPAFTNWLLEQSSKSGKSDVATAVAGLEGFAKLAETPAAISFLCAHLPAILSLGGELLTMVHVYTIACMLTFVLPCRFQTDSDP